MSLSLSTHHEEELSHFEQFIVEQLSPQQRRVLKLFAIYGHPYKEVAQLLNRDEKTIEKLVAKIIQKYQIFFGGAEKNASFRRIQSRAACYYFLEDLIV